MEHLFERQARLNVMKRPVRVVTYFFLIPGLIFAYLLGFYQRLHPSLDKPCFLSLRDWSRSRNRSATTHEVLFNARYLSTDCSEGRSSDDHRLCRGVADRLRHAVDSKCSRLFIRSLTCLERRSRSWCHSNEPVG